MRSFPRGRRGSGAVISLAAIVLVGMFSMRLARQQASPTPLQLFQKMLPVVRHPRCMNCHGGIDPGDSTRHGGGAITVEACEQCHTDVSHWDLPGRDHFFVGKTDKELCSLFAEFAMKQGHARFISNHLRGDELIIAAFKGVMAGARNPGFVDPPNPPQPPADPPRGGQDAFVKLGQDWLDYGQGSCDMLGTITLEESVAASDTFSLGPIETRNTYTGTRTVTLNLRDGKYYADIRTDYTDIQVSKSKLENPKTGQPCYLTYTRTERHVGATTDVASVAIKDTIFFADTKPPQTDYRIDVMLPPETTQKTESRTANDGCQLGMPFPPESETGSFKWGRTKFVIEGHVEDPKIDGRAGSCDRISKSTEINTDKLEWDRSHPCFKFKRMGNSWYLGLMRRTLPTTFHDLTPIPYHLRASWNLKYTK
jgi:hypothetical protein